MINRPRRRTIGHEPRNRKTHVYLTATEHEALDTLAVRWGCTVSTLIRALCEIGVSCIEHHGATPDEIEPGRPPGAKCGDDCPTHGRAPGFPDPSVLFPFGLGHDRG